MTVFTCIDTLDAMMTCIYDAWDARQGHRNIRLATEPLGELELFCEYRHIDADMQKSRRVIRAIRQKISREAWQMVLRCAMSDLPDKLDIIYRFLLLGFAHGAGTVSMLSHPYVMALFEANRRVCNETRHFQQFLRFQSLPGGVLAAHIEPKANLLALLAPAFKDRLPSENWMILDDRRRLALVHPSEASPYLTTLGDREWELLRQTESLPDPFGELWKTFFHSVSIKERANPACQRSLLPLQYRGHMTEFR